MLDLVYTNALVVDGDGGAPWLGSVGVLADRIAWLGRAGAEVPSSIRTVPCAGMALAPGFVDVHNHSDLSPVVDPEMPSTVRQGVTTVVVGNCGISPWPLSGWDECVRMAYADPADHAAPPWSSWGDYLGAIDAAHPVVNVATLVGHGSVREAVMGLDRRTPSPEELGRMRSLVREAVREGAVGVSTGLIYVPGMFSATDEVAAIASASAGAGGLYASHIRGEGRDLFRAIGEAIEVGKRAELPVHVSHLKCESSRVRGRAAELLATLHDGGDATADQYPYAAWNSNLASLLPPWAPVSQLSSVDPERLRRAVEEGEDDFQSSVDGVGWERIVISQTRDDRWNGMDLAAIGRAMSVSAFDALIALLLEDPDAMCIGHAMDETDVRTILSDRRVFVASDGAALRPDSAAGRLPVHPRDYGTFPRALALARDRALLPLGAVVRKMTSLPAERFGLRDRGRIAEGAFADLVLLDPASVRDTATYEHPQVFPEGIDMVLVNGTVAWESGRPDAYERAGRALRRGG